MAGTSGRSSRYRWMIPILLLAFLLRIAYLDAQSMWYDEVFYATVSSVDLSSLLGVVLDVRVQPPLYFLILHFWLGLGQSELVLRALSVFAGVLGVSGMFPLGTAIGSRRLGTIGAFALAISPFHIWYSQEVKMYSLIALLVLLSSYFLLRVLTEDKATNWLGYALFTSLAVYTHYLAPFVMVAHMACLTLLRHRYRALLGKWLACATIVGLLYAPWLAAIFLTGGFSQGSISWIPPAQPVDLFWTIYDFALGSTSDNTQLFNVVAALLLVAILIYVSVQLRSAKIPVEQRDRLSLIWFWLFLPLVLVFLISLDWPLPQKRSIYMDRYLILLLPAFVILVCYGIGRVFQTKGALGTLVSVALLAAVSVSVCSLFLDQSYHRDQWRQAITDIKQNARAGDILLVRPNHRVVLSYYDLKEIPWHTVPYLGSRQEYETLLDREVPTRLGEGGRLWALTVCENANAHGFGHGARDSLLRKVADDPIRAWLLQHYRLLEEHVYQGIYLASYGST